MVLFQHVRSYSKQTGISSEVACRLKFPEDLEPKTQEPSGIVDPVVRLHLDSLVVRVVDEQIRSGVTADWQVHQPLPHHFRDVPGRLTSAHRAGLPEEVDFIR